MAESFLKKYKNEDSESSGSSDDEIITKISKQPLPPKHSPYNDYRPYSPSYNINSTLRNDYKYSDKALSPKKDAISVLKSLTKNESPFTQSSDGSSKNSEVTFQWNERTGSLTLIENDTMQSKKIDNSLKGSRFSEENEGLSVNLIDRSNNLELLIKEFSNPNLNITTFRTRLIREMNDTQIDLKEAQSRISMLVRDKAAMKEQLVNYKDNLKKLMSGCKLLQEELKK